MAIILFSELSFQIRYAHPALLPFAELSLHIESMHCSHGALLPLPRLPENPLLLIQAPFAIFQCNLREPMGVPGSPLLSKVPPFQTPSLQLQPPPRPRVPLLPSLPRSWIPGCDSGLGNDFLSCHPHTEEFNRDQALSKGRLSKGSQ